MTFFKSIFVEVVFASRYLARQFEIFKLGFWFCKDYTVRFKTHFHRLALRKCSYQFKTLVNASKLRIYRLSLQFSTRYVLVTRDTGDICTSSELEFERLDQGYSERYCRCKYNATCFYNKNHYIDKAIQKFLSVLRDPAVYVEEVSIDFWAGILHEKEINRLYSKITSALKSVNRQIPVRRIHIEIIHEPNSDYLLKILNCLQPKFLESLSVSKYRKVFEDNNTIDFSEIQKTEQWKKLKKLNVDGFMSELSFEQTKHFSTMDYKMNELQLELVKQIINVSLVLDWVSQRNHISSRKSSKTTVCNSGASSSTRSIVPLSSTFSLVSRRFPTVQTIRNSKQPATMSQLISLWDQCLSLCQKSVIEICFLFRDPK